MGHPVHTYINTYIYTFIHLFLHLYIHTYTLYTYMQYIIHQCIALSIWGMDILIGGKLLNQQRQSWSFTETKKHTASWFTIIGKAQSNDINPPYQYLNQTQLLYLTTRRVFCTLSNPWPQIPHILLPPTVLYTLLISESCSMQIFRQEWENFWQYQ